MKVTVDAPVHSQAGRGVTTHVRYPCWPVVRHDDPARRPHGYNGHGRSNVLTTALPREPTYQKL